MRSSYRLSNLKANEQLGMNAGTASKKLYRLLLYHYAFKLGKTTCLRCHNLIYEDQDFHLDHFEPWMDSSRAKELFFDLENVFLSHAACNISAGRRGIRYNATRFRGVYFDRSRKKKPWRVAITVDGRQTTVGSFFDPIEAAKKYNEEARKAFGDKAVLNKTSWGTGTIE